MAGEGQTQTASKLGQGVKAPVVARYPKDRIRIGAGLELGMG